MEAHRGIRSIEVLFFLPLRWMGWVAKAAPRPLFPWERDAAPIVQEAWWAAGTVWTGARNFALTGLRSSDRPSRRE